MSTLCFVCFIVFLLPERSLYAGLASEPSRLCGAAQCHRFRRALAAGRRRVASQSPSSKPFTFGESGRRRGTITSGKVLVPTTEAIQKLVAARLAADVMGVPRLIMARTNTDG